MKKINYLNTKQTDQLLTYVCQLAKGSKLIGGTIDDFYGNEVHWKCYPDDDSYTQALISEGCACTEFYDSEYFMIALVYDTDYINVLLKKNVK